MVGKPFKRRGRQPLGHFKLLATLLYGDFSWIERHAGSISVPARELTKALGSTHDQVKDWINVLITLGLIECSKHYGSFVVLKLRTPFGYSEHGASSLDLEETLEAEIVS